MTLAASNILEGATGAQRTAADPTASVWVAANAGSGKTTVLVNRVIRLMLAGTPLGRILCLTFTRAAAAEMKNRLFHDLGAWTALSDAELEKKVFAVTGRKVPPDGLLAARRLFALALDTPGGLKIDTIHAFCQSLIGRFPLEAEVAPHAAVMDERTAGELMAEARDRVLVSAHDGTHAELAEALDRMVVRVDESGFDELTKEIARDRAKIAYGVERRGGLGAAIRALHRLLGLGEGEDADAIVAAACADGAFDAAGLAHAASALERGSQSDRERAAAVRAWISDPAARPALLKDSYFGVFLTQKGEPRAEKSFVTKAVAVDARAAEALRHEQDRIAAVNERLKAAAVAQSSADLLRLAVALNAAYDEEKTERALLDYDDLILKARNLLGSSGGVSWVLYKLDGGIDHVLIDEAQDTSPEQWRVVRSLADEFFAGAGAREDLLLPRTLFAVGDKKQSIFSFQGADIAEFEHMHAHFKHRASEARRDFKRISLEFSFRSAPTILKAVDLVFARDPARHGVALDGETIEHRPIRTGHAGLVEIWPAEKPQPGDEPNPWDAPLDQLPADNPRARLAQRIARLISSWRDTGEVLSSRGRPVRPEDIMILVRRRGPFFDEMVRALKVENVPVAGVDRMVLTEQLAVMDLMALGRFALLPEDDLTLATILKCPLFGLGDDDLFRLAHKRSGSLWSSLKSRAGEEAPFRRAHDELAEILSRADFATPFEFFARVLSESGGRKRILARLGPEANDPLDEFLSLALAYGREHAPSLQGFLHWLSLTPIEIKRDLEEARHEVRVMTVHGAKGLEADIVFLPDTCSVPDHRQNARILWTADDAAMLWPGGSGNEEAVCAAARAVEQSRRDEEYRRLLYVAMTRARDRLYVCGFEGKKPPPADCWYNLVRDALEPKTRKIEFPDGTMVLRLEDAQRAEPVDKHRAEEAEAAGALPAWAQRPPLPEPDVAIPLAPSRPRDEEPAALSPLAGEGGAGVDAYARGRIIHRLLELLPEIAPAAREAACRRFLARPLHALDASAQEAIMRETLAILNHPDFSELFAPGSRAEVPLAGRIGDFIVAGQVDRLAVSEKRVLIVDYKTNRPVPNTAAEAPAAYLRQMAAYRVLLARIYPGREICCVLLWTSEPRLMPLAAEILDAYAP